MTRKLKLGRQMVCWKANAMGEGWILGTAAAMIVSLLLSAVWLVAAVVLLVFLVDDILLSAAIAAVTTAVFGFWIFYSLLKKMDERG